MGLQHLSASNRKKVASLGGRTAHAQGKAHKWTSEEATEAVKKTKRYKKKHETN